MELRILGGMELIGAQGPVPLGGRKQRTILAALVLRRPAGISVSEIVDLLWPETPPRSALKNIQTYVWALRRALESSGCARPLIKTQTSGYHLCMGTMALDWDRFQKLAAAGGGYLDGDPERALGVLDQALALWRGSAFADITDDLGNLRPLLVRFGEAQWQAQEDRVAALMELGRYGTAITDLHGLVAVTPLRESLYQQLMLALYRTHRQAEALNAYSSIRRLLAEELGINPCAAVEELYARILRGDPSLLQDGPRTTA